MSDPKSPDSPIRKVVADHLYLDRGPAEACSRCDANAQFGAVDLCEEMIRHAQLDAGKSIVDVGCGAGQHLVRFAEVVGSNGAARGFDFSEKAVEKTRSRGLQADVADGANLPLDDDYCDAVTSSFSIYYLADREKTLREWHRILRPGGRVAISGPAEDTNVELYEFHKSVTGEGPADTDLMALGYVADLDETMKSVGFTDVEIHSFTNPIEFPTADAFVEYWTNTSLFARSVDDAAREAVIQKGRELLEGQEPPFVVTKRVTVAVGVCK